MTTPSEPRAEDTRSDDLETPDAGTAEQGSSSDVAGADPDSVRQGAEPIAESSPGALPDESMGPP